MIDKILKLIIYPFHQPQMYVEMLFGILILVAAILITIRVINIIFKKLDRKVNKPFH